MSCVENDAYDIISCEWYEEYDKGFGIDHDDDLRFDCECHDNSRVYTKLKDRVCECYHRNESIIQFVKFISSVAIVGFYYYASCMMMVGCVLTLVEILSQIVQSAALHQAKNGSRAADQDGQQFQVDKEAANVERAFSTCNELSLFGEIVVNIVKALRKHDVWHVRCVLADVGCKLILSGAYEEFSKKLYRVCDDNNDNNNRCMLNLVFCMASAICTSIIFGGNALFYASFQLAIGCMMRSVDNATNWIMDYQE